MRRMLVVLVGITLMLASVTPAQARPTYKANLTGSAVVAGGDVDGSGVAKVTPNQKGKICYTIAVRNVGKVTAARIRRGPPGAGGSIVLDLRVARNGLKACVAAKASFMETLKLNPGAYYIVVSTVQHPSGALRGQFG